MSDNKVDNKLDFSNVKQTQLDPGQVLRGSFSELQSGLRVFDTNPILRDGYTHFLQQVNASGYPTFVEYWQATSPAIDKLQFGPDIAGSKAGTYIVLQEYLTKRTHVLYYVVSGSGTAPGIGDTETAININNNDAASLIAYATRLAFDNIEEFTANQNGILSSSLEIEYLQFGETAGIDVATSGFITTRLVQGTSFKVGEVYLDYDVNGDPIYGGNTLKGMLFNPYTASFDIERSDITATVDLDRPVAFNISNIAVPLANIEVSIPLPDGTKKFKLQTREGNTQLTLRKASGDPDYFTIKYGSSYMEEGLNTVGVVLYIETSRDSRNLELITWA